VVSAASYEARKYGIHSAMPLRTAGKLCPHAIFLDGHHAKYGEWSDRIASILSRFSPVVEMVSVDEAYIDLSGTERMHGPPLAATDKLLRTITRETGLPARAAWPQRASPPRSPAIKLKPRGLVWVAPGQEATFLAPLPVRKIPGIGEVTERALRALGIETVAQLAKSPLKNSKRSSANGALPSTAKPAAAIRMNSSWTPSQNPYPQPHLRRRHRRSLYAPFHA